VHLAGWAAVARGCSDNPRRRRGRGLAVLAGLAVPRAAQILCERAGWRRSWVWAVMMSQVQRSAVAGSAGLGGGPAEICLNRRKVCSKGRSGRKNACHSRSTSSGVAPVREDHSPHRLGVGAVAGQVNLPAGGSGVSCDDGQRAVVSSQAERWVSRGCSAVPGLAPRRVPYRVVPVVGDNRRPAAWPSASARATLLAVPCGGRPLRAGLPGRHRKMQHAVRAPAFPVSSTGRVSELAGQAHGVIPCVEDDQDRPGRPRSGARR